AWNPDPCPRPTVDTSDTRSALLRFHWFRTSECRTRGASVGRTRRCAGSEEGGNWSSPHRPLRGLLRQYEVDDDRMSRDRPKLHSSSPMCEPLPRTASPDSATELPCIISTIPLPFWPPPRFLVR